MAETRAQPNYQYTRPAAQSTRQLLDSTSLSLSPSTDPNEVPSRPQNLPLRKSSNYAEADARARAAAGETHASSAEGDRKEEEGREGEARTDGAAGAGTGGSGTPSASWRPRSGRKLSWNRQDFKREMHMAAVAGAAKGHGFTEAATGTATGTGN